MLHCMAFKVGEESTTFEGSPQRKEKGSGEGKGPKIPEGSEGGKGSAAEGPKIVEEEQEEVAGVGSVLKVGEGSINFEGSAPWEEKGRG